jgi:hypothetical protein
MPLEGTRWRVHHVTNAVLCRMSSGTCAFHCQLAFPHFRPEGHCRVDQHSVDGGGLRGNADCSADERLRVRNLAMLLRRSAAHRAIATRRAAASQVGSTAQ